LVQYFAQFN